MGLATVPMNVEGRSQVRSEGRRPPAEGAGDGRRSQNRDPQRCREKRRPVIVSATGAAQRLSAGTRTPGKSRNRNGCWPGARANPPERVPRRRWGPCENRAGPASTQAFRLGAVNAKGDCQAAQRRYHGGRNSCECASRMQADPRARPLRGTAQGVDKASGSDGHPQGGDQAFPEKNLEGASVLAFPPQREFGKACEVCRRRKFPPKERPQGSCLN